MHNDMTSQPSMNTPPPASSFSLAQPPAPVAVLAAENRSVLLKFMFDNELKSKK